MAESIIKIVSVNDSDLIDYVKDVAESVSERYRPKDFNVLLIGSSNRGFPTKDIGDQQEIQFIKNKRFKSIVNLSMSFAPSEFTFQYFRGGRQRNYATFDEIVFSWNEQQGLLPDETRSQILQITFDRLSASTASSASDDEEVGFSVPVLSTFALETIRQTQAVGLEFAKDIQSFERTLQEIVLEKSSELEKKYLERERVLETTIEEKKNRLALQQSELEVKEAQFNAREPRHVRRQLREELLVEIKRRSETFSLTKGTKRLRWPMHLVLVAAMTYFGYIAFLFNQSIIIDMNSNQVGMSWLPLAIKGTVMSLLTAGTAFYYLRWLNKWFEEHSQREFRLKQLQIDIERASWLVETALEWDQEKKEPMPEALLESLAKGIFINDPDRSEPLRNPADELASALLGSAAVAKIKIGESELSLDRKSLRGIRSHRVVER